MVIFSVLSMLFIPESISIYLIYLNNEYANNEIIKDRIDTTKRITKKYDFFGGKSSVIISVNHIEIYKYIIINNTNNYYKI